MPLPAFLTAMLASSAARAAMGAGVGSIIFGLGYGASVNVGYNTAKSFTQPNNFVRRSRSWQRGRGSWTR